MKTWHKALAVGIIVFFLVAMIPLTQGAPPPKTNTPTLKVLTGSYNGTMAEYVNDKYFFPLPEDKIIHLRVAFYVKITSQTGTFDIYLHFIQPIDNQVEWTRWNYVDNSNPYHELDVLVDTNGPVMPHFDMDNPGSANIVFSISIVWWAEYLE